MAEPFKIGDMIAIVNNGPVVIDKLDRETKTRWVTEQGRRIRKNGMTTIGAGKTVLRLDDPIVMRRRGEAAIQSLGGQIERYVREQRNPGPGRVSPTNALLAIRDMVEVAGSHLGAISRGEV